MPGVGDSHPAMEGSRRDGDPSKMRVEADVSDALGGLVFEVTVIPS